MTTKLKSLLLALALGAMSATAQTSGLAQQPTVADTVQVMATKMNRPIKVVVTLPDQYTLGDKTARYPVLYLLHGADGSYRDWPRKADLHSYANRYAMIIVCPDGQDSWYFDSPIDSTFQFETFISKELVSYIDSHYRTYATPLMRAITGLSMGGHGALWNAWRHPDVFHSCGSMSGGVDIYRFPDEWKMSERLGPWQSNQDVWKRHSVLSLVPTLKPGQNIIIDDGQNDIFIQENNNLHEQLLYYGIPHDYTVRPGKHSWSYWVNSLAYHMLYFSNCFAQAAAQLQQQPASH